MLFSLHWIFASSSPEHQINQKIPLITVEDEFIPSKIKLTNEHLDVICTLCAYYLNYTLISI